MPIRTPREHEPSTSPPALHLEPQGHVLADDENKKRFSRLLATQKDVSIYERSMFSNQEVRAAAVPCKRPRGAGRGASGPLPMGIFNKTGNNGEVPGAPGKCLCHTNAHEGARAVTPGTTGGPAPVCSQTK